MKRFWFFDLDGTLADTDGDIRLAWKAALADLGLACPTFDRDFIAGPPIDEMVKKLFPDRCADPAAAERLHISDEKRILRALEVYRETGKTITEHNEATKALPPRYRALWLGLRYQDRDEMRAALDRRVDAMMEAGLLEEVKALAASAPRNATALQAIGYKELLPVLDGEKALADGIAEVKLRTRQYAKRQLTWFRRNPQIHWLERREGQDFSEIVHTSTDYCLGNGVC